MTFAERLKNARESAGLTQEELAAKSGISLHAVRAWEEGKRPRALKSVAKVATVLNVSPDAMLSISDRCVIEAYAKGGARAVREVEELISEVDEHIAYRDIDDREKDGIVAALCEAYWIAKRRNEKYTPKKYRK